VSPGWISLFAARRLRQSHSMALSLIAKIAGGSLSNTETVSKFASNDIPLSYLRLALPADDA